MSEASKIDGSFEAQSLRRADPGGILKVSEEILGLGVGTAVLVSRGIDNSTISPLLIAYKRKLGKQLAAFWKNRSVSAHPSVREYHRLHQQFGVDSEPASPEKLITFVRRKRDLTGASAVVDCYNLVSARTLLSIGAHDLKRLRFPISLRRLRDNDQFLPLGETSHRPCGGEYGYVDPDARVICRLEVLQCEETKVDVDSTEIAFFLQGNSTFRASDLLEGAWLLAEMVGKFLGGNSEVVGFNSGLTI